MKIALYIEDGLEQIVLTPQTETEFAILKNLEPGKRTLEIKSGAFYACRGGWVRQKKLSQLYSDWGQEEDQSLMIVLRPKEG